MENLIIFSAYPHDDPYKQRHHHLLPYYSKHFKKVVSITSIMPLKKRLISIIKNPKRLLRPDCKDNGKIKFITIYPIFPNKICFKFNFLFRLNSLVYLLQLKDLNYNNCLISTPHPFIYTDYLNKIKTESNTICYDCPDVYEDFPWSNPNITIPLENKMCKIADFCFASSNFISKLKSEQHSVPFYTIHNGVDINFHRKNTREVISWSQRKDICYLGSLAEWFDHEMLEFIAKETKSHGFLIHVIGSPSPATREKLFQILKKHKNIVYHGQQHYSDIPNKLAKYRVGIIPFKKVPLINGVSPLKLFEYAANGLNIVSTEWDEIKIYSENVYLSRNKIEFVNNILKAYKKDYINEQIEFANKNDWDSRLKEMISIIKER